MLVLFESPLGYAVFKILNEKKLKETENLFLEFETPERASKLLKLKHFEKFKDMKDALSVATAVVEGKMHKKLKKVIKKAVIGEVQEQLAVADAKLGNAIKDKFNISCVSNTSIQELMRCIRGHMDSLVDLTDKEMTTMALGLAHSLSRYKLKFTPDKIDTMIIQAIALLDDLDKELNNYVMRCKEWYGWHFPELSKIVTDNTQYVKTVFKMGVRTNAITSDLSDILPGNIEQEVKDMAEISMGTDISEEDMFHIRQLCHQILESQVSRTDLYEYVKNRMIAIAPNVTSLVGEMVGARLIAHAGSLLNLAKHPASTVQILGAEKALFRALKTKHDTPKYGLIYHAQLVGQTNTHLKGKISRMLAAKTALACRVDALGDENSTMELGMEQRAKLEKQLKILEEGGYKRISGTGKAKFKREKYENKSDVVQYKDADDTFLPSQPKPDKKRKRQLEETTEDTDDTQKKKKRKVPKTEEEGDDDDNEDKSHIVKKKKKKIKADPDE